MGTWGNKVTQDDFVLDVIDTFVSSLKVTQDVQETTKSTIQQYASELEDPDDGPLFWLGLAEAQWRFGATAADVVAKMKDDQINGRGLDRWRDEGSKELDARKSELASFIDKVERPNPKPKSLPKLVKRKPLYNPGDCLSIKLDDGVYTAAVVLKSDTSNPELGLNLIAILDYLSQKEPSLNDFERRGWLVLNYPPPLNRRLDVGWYMPVAYKKYKHKFSVVGQTVIRPEDPQESTMYCPWATLGEKGKRREPV